MDNIDDHHDRMDRTDRTNDEDDEDAEDAKDATRIPSNPCSTRGTGAMIIKDPENYRRMSEPFATKDEAVTAISSFLRAVEDARQKFRIADVFVVAECDAITAEGEGRFGLSLQLGDSSKKLPMLAREFGVARSQYEDQLAVLTHGLKRKAT